MTSNQNIGDKYIEEGERWTLDFFMVNLSSPPQLLTHHPLRGLILMSIFDCLRYDKKRQMHSTQSHWFIHVSC
jgi:hypothetical protein